jgi:hypothetical protein
VERRGRRGVEMVVQDRGSLVEYKQQCEKEEMTTGRRTLENSTL